MLLRCGVLLSTFVIVAVGSVSASTLPDPVYIRYQVHQDSDPQEPVSYEIGLVLTALERGGDDIGWRVDGVEIRKIDSSGGADFIWRDLAPEVDTQDGLWWVTHADADAPTNADFVEPPPVAGQAATVQRASADLDYELEGEVYTSPPEGDPWEVTASLSFVLTLDGETEPLEEKSEENSEMPPAAPQPSWD